MSDDPPAYDERLWITRAGMAGRGYVLGNPHTHRGRMTAWFPATGESLYFSKHEVVDSSPEAAAWIAGFLAGSEPEPEDVFGPGITFAPDDDERWARWRAMLAEYRESGLWRHGRWVEVAPFPPDTPLPPYPWTLRGPEVWAWQDGEWRRADPQPRLDDGLLAGSACATRGHCSLAVVTEEHVVCADCGSVSFSAPWPPEPGG